MESCRTLQSNRRRLLSTEAPPAPLSDVIISGLGLRRGATRALAVCSDPCVVQVGYTRSRFVEPSPPRRPACARSPTRGGQGGGGGGGQGLLDTRAVMDTQRGVSRRDEMPFKAVTTHKARPANGLTGSTQQAKLEQVSVVGAWWSWSAHAHTQATGCARSGVAGAVAPLLPGHPKPPRHGHRPTGPPSKRRSPCAT